MRQWIDLVEARRPVIDPTTRAQAVYDHILKVAAQLSKTSYNFRSGWDQSWVKMIRDGLTTAKQEHDTEQKSEAAYHADENRPHTPVPFEVRTVLPDVTFKWWQTTAHDAAYQLEVDAKYEYENYQDDHPRVEQSDEMSALHDQWEMTRQIYFKGSDSIEGMTTVLDAIESYADSLDRYVLQDSMTRSAEDFIKKVIPAFMTICSLMGAKKI